MDGGDAVSRRDLLGMSLAGMASLYLGSRASGAARGGLRLGGPVFEKYQDPEGWVRAVKKLGYSAAYCPVGAEAADEVVKA